MGGISREGQDEIEREREKWANCYVTITNSANEIQLKQENQQETIKTIVSLLFLPLKVRLD